MHPDHEQGSVKQVVIVGTLPDVSRDQEEEHGRSRTVPPVFFSQIQDSTPEFVDLGPHRALPVCRLSSYSYHSSTNSQDKVPGACVNYLRCELGHRAPAIIGCGHGVQFGATAMQRARR